MALQVNTPNVSLPVALPSMGVGSDVAFAAQRGKVGRTDQTAMNMAVASINGSLSSPANAGDRIGAADLKVRIESLIDAQIAGGILSDKQAAVLRAYFGTGGMVPAEAEKAPPPPPPTPPVQADALNKKKQLQEAYPGATPDTKDPRDPIDVFLQKLRHQSPTGVNGYNSLAGSSTARRAPALLDISA